VEKKTHTHKQNGVIKTVDCKNAGKVIITLYPSFARYHGGKIGKVYIESRISPIKLHINPIMSKRNIYNDQYFCLEYKHLFTLSLSNNNGLIFLI
jgi:hypothetical protein